MNKVLIVVDYQNDFALSSGALSVPDGIKICHPIVNLTRNNKFSLKIATKDMHPVEHCSFKKNGGIWPFHCIAGTTGAELFNPKGFDNYIDYIIHKGTNKDIDSYSAFYDNDRKKYTGLGHLISFLNENNKRAGIYICGLALDYCVKYTAVDALEFSDKVFIIEDAVKAIEQDERKLSLLKEEIKSKGVQFVNSENI